MNVTTPLAVEVPDAAEIVSFAPREEVRLTVLPDNGFEFASVRVTVIVKVEEPFAGTVLTLATTVDRV